MTSDRLKILLALLAGLLTNLAFEPAGLFPVVFVTLSILFWIWQRASSRICAWSGFAFGLGLHGFGIHWIYYSLHDFGGAPPALAVVMVFALVCVLSLLIAACGYIQARVQISQAWRLFALIPALWVVFEWIRSWLFTGFPWLYVGYSQTDSWLVGWAPLLGVFGVSLAVCVLAGVLVYSISTGFSLRVLALVVPVLVIGFIGREINWITFTHPPIKIAIVQGDIDIFDKWDARQARSNLEFYVKQSQLLGGNDLVVWPEIALAQTNVKLEKLRLWKLLMNYSPDFLVGVLEEYDTDQTVLYFNSAFGITDKVQKYRKTHLVPFGEFIPFRSFLGWLENFVEIPASDLSSYAEPQKPLILAGQPAGISICYEDAFPQDILDMLPEATYLINISEDAWFGTKIAPFQRLQMSRMRAMETARPVLRAANKGISASIDHRGVVVAQLAQAQGRVLTTAVTPTSGSTPFVRFGNLPVLFLCSVLVVLVIGTSARSRVQN